MIRAICAFIFKVLGWKLIVEIPPDLKKYIIAAIPHTSSLDFPLGLMARSVLKLDIKYVGKHTLFRPPLGPIFYWLGGYPVNRTARGNFVDAVVDIFNEKEEFIICIAPEGTREKVDRLKTGFYHIAKGANVAIIPTKLDYANRELTFGKPFYPTDDEKADFEFLENYFKGVRGRNPEKGWKVDA